MENLRAKAREEALEAAKQLEEVATVQQLHLSDFYPQTETESLVSHFTAVCSVTRSLSR